MAHDTKKENAERRVQQGLAALATFARIREDLIVLRETTLGGGEFDKLSKQLLRLNEATMEELRKIVQRDEDDLLREPGNSA
jgi:hypothetical protein